MDRREFVKKAAMAAVGATVVSPVSAMLSEMTGKQCKVLLVNGSPRTDGNTFCCLKEIESELQKHGVASEIVQIGRKPVRMCINCGGCRAEDASGCVFDDDACAVITQKMKEADALIVGTPVYYGQPNGGILSLMQRMFFSVGHLVQNKPAAALAVCMKKDAEGMQTMRTLATNMAFLLKKIHADGQPAPQREERPQFMNFIR